MSMPAGLLGLADIASGEKRSVAVSHLGVELIADPAFSLSSLLGRETPALVGISLHFHPQANEVVKTVRTVRKALPSAFIFLGGYTASFFADEILRTVPEADAVVRGEAEEPVRLLAAGLPARGADLSGVPNVSWRRGGEVVHNPLTYTAGESDLAKVSRTRLSLMRHGALYAKFAQHLYFHKPDLSLENNLRLHRDYVGFPLPLVRGCPFSCIYCGGGSAAQKTLNNRCSLTAVPVDRALDEFAALCGQGVSQFSTDYVPLGDGDKYYTELFRGLRSRGLKVSLSADCRALPSGNFLEAFAACFPDDPGSRLNFSPEAAGDELRIKLKGGAARPYAELLRTLAEAERLKIRSGIFFNYSMPGMDEAETAALKAEVPRLRREFPHVSRITISPAELDPCSPLHLDPAGYGLSASLKTFGDYCVYHLLATPVFCGTGYSVGGRKEKGAGRLPGPACADFCRLTLQTSWRLPGALKKILDGGARLACRLCRAYLRRGELPPRADYFPY